MHRTRQNYLFLQILAFKNGIYPSCLHNTGTPSFNSFFLSCQKQAIISASSFLHTTMCV